uniref:Sulfatase domain-containing protein n=1 Tax=Parastrongyloides trichosuri TaxID=131310 RepID=A0A0N4ZSQ9_PARTI
MLTLLYKKKFFLFLKYFVFIVGICLEKWTYVGARSENKIINNNLFKKPNIILLITDDQDKELGSMEFMPKTLKIFDSEGIEFTHGLVSTPICCPSRTSILTGKYVHNHNVMTNNQNCSGVEWRTVHEKRTFLNLVKLKGNYATSYFGKYLNEYDGSYVPEGIDHFMGLIKNSRFYNYTVNLNGKKIKHGYDYHKDYFTDKIANDTINFIERHVTLNKNVPFLSVLSFPAPHGPEDSAPQYSQLFDGIQSHRTSAWNYAPNPDKQWILQRTGKMEPIHVVFTDLLHRRRLQTLQSVDDAVEKLINKLKDLDQLDNTFLIYTSDHGYHLGQFGLVKGKNMPFEFDIKVPFYIRGPGIGKNRKINNIVSNIDIAPTILNIAGVEIDKEMDGKSFLSLILNNSNNDENGWRDTLLIERGKMPKLKRIKERFLKQKEVFSKKEIIEKVCKSPEYHGDCLEEQKWKCIKNDSFSNWNVIKCRDFIEINNKKCDCENTYKVRMKREVDNDTREKGYVDETIIKNMKKFIIKILSRWEEEFVRDHYLNNDVWHQGIIETKSKRNVFKSYNISTNNKNDEEFNKEFIPTLALDVLCLTVDSNYCESELNYKIKKLKKKLYKIRETRRKLKSRIKCNCSLINNNDRHYKSLNDYFITTNPELNISDIIYHEKNESVGVPLYGRKYKNLSKRKTKKGQLNTCNLPQMNCFTHDYTHWKTEPFWPENYGKFCFCQNTNNNTYWCLRTFNETHNFLYCEFITGFISYYDINNDPSQLSNIVYSLDINILEQLSTQLQLLKTCKGVDECEHYSSKNWNLPFLNDKFKNKK